MGNYKIEFIVDKAEKIVLEYQDSLENINCCHEGLIILLDKQQIIPLCLDSIFSSMQSFSFVLKKVLSNELLLDASINQDIGFLYNQYCYLLWSENSITIDDFVYETSQENGPWIGMRYHVWAYENAYVSWMYNDRNNDIVFEITPFYPYFHCEPKDVACYISYHEWIKCYKSFLIRKISKKTAQEWFHQADQIIQQISLNLQR